jgi:hypothetical protein
MRHLTSALILATVLIGGFGGCETRPEPTVLAALSEQTTDPVHAADVGVYDQGQTEGWHPCGNHTTRTACQACPYWCVWTGGRCW